MTIARRIRNGFNTKFGHQDNMSKCERFDFFDEIKITAILTSNLRNFRRRLFSGHSDFGQSS